MRIRRRATDAPPQAKPPSSSHTRSSPAPSAASPCSETAAARLVQPPSCKVDLSVCEATPSDPRLSSSGRSRQVEKEESDKTTEDGKGGEEEGRWEYEHRRPVHVVWSTQAVPKGEQEEGRMEVEEKNSTEDSSRVKDDEEGIAAAICKKGDGKGWHCKRVAQCGYSLCQYHLDKLRSYGCYSQKKKKKKPKTASVPKKCTAAGIHHQEASQQRKTTKRRMEEHDLGKGPGVWDSFYYYSGFGPRWGKRRGDTSVDGVEVPESDSVASQVHPHQDMGDAGAAVYGGEEEEEEEFDCVGRSRDGKGKPFKSRPLSSLL